MIQTFNFLLAIIMFNQVLYLFTCGTKVMRKIAKMERISYTAMRVFYLSVISIVLLGSTLRPSHYFEDTLLYIAICSVLHIQGMRVYRTLKRNKK